MSILTFRLQRDYVHNFFTKNRLILGNAYKVGSLIGLGQILNFYYQHEVNRNLTNDNIYADRIRKKIGTTPGSAPGTAVGTITVGTTTVGTTAGTAPVQDPNEIIKKIFEEIRAEDKTVKEAVKLKKAAKKYPF